MGKGTEKDKDVPDGVIVRAIVMGTEISAGSIGYALGQDKKHRTGGKALHHWLCNKDNAPAHNEINGQRESRPSSHCEDFIESATYDGCPLQGKYKPAKPTTYDTDEDGRIGAGNHDVDADMVAFAQGLFQSLTMYPVIDGTAEEHKEHAEKKADDTKHHLPTDVGSQPCQPNGTQGKNGSAQMRPCVALLGLIWPKVLRLHLASGV